MCGLWSFLGPRNICRHTFVTLYLHLENLPIPPIFVLQSKTTTFVVSGIHINCHGQDALNQLMFPQGIVMLVVLKKPFGMEFPPLKGVTISPALEGGKTSLTNWLRLKLHFGPYPPFKSQNICPSIAYRMASSINFFMWSAT